MESNVALMESIRNTNRKITKVSIDFFGYIKETQMQTALFIIKKFSAFIKYLKLEADIFVIDYLFEILSLVPNAECLVFSYLHKCRTENKKRRIAPSNDDDLNLHHLKTLKLFECQEDFLVVFNRLPAGVLTELQLSIYNLETLTVLFKRQTNIKKFNLERHSQGKLPTCNDNIFDNLQLESLMWRQHKYTRTDKILSKQKNLKFLRLNNELIGEGVMNVVTNQLTELETLAMDVSNVSLKSFLNIKKLKKLKMLTLFSDAGVNLSKLESFAKLDNSRITNLDIRRFPEISVDVVSALAKSVPNLKILRFNFKNYMIFNAIRRNFNFVEALMVNDDLKQHHDTNNLIQDECTNAKLIELHLMFLLPYETPFLNNLIKDYTNLKKLTITSLTPISASQFKQILDGLTKIESLELFGASKLTIDDVDCLKDYKKNLKFISFSDFKFKLKTGHKKKLSTMFDVVKFGRRGFLAMSVDRTIMMNYMIESKKNLEPLAWD